MQKNSLSCIKDIKIFKEIYYRLMTEGKICNPRGLKVIEVENFNYKLSPYVRFINFESRKLNIEYIKKEFLWYLKGDKYDTSIVQHAGMWKDLINEDFSINSNYGQYIFGDQLQFRRAQHTLELDKDSRRASIIILSHKHLESFTKDYPCTYSINFRIRDNKLNMTVRMRSQDAVLGMGNDVPAFSFIHEMMYVTLKETYPELEYGEYYHSCDSFHVYEKHFNMVASMILNDDYEIVDCPKIKNKKEVDYLMKGEFHKIPKDFKFTKWLTNYEKIKK